MPTRPRRHPARVPTSSPASRRADAQGTTGSPKRPGRSRKVGTASAAASVALAAALAVAAPSSAPATRPAARESAPASRPATRPAAAAALKVTAVPPAEVERLRLDPFYTKYVDLDGFPVVGSVKAIDQALLEAAFIVRQMLAHRPEVREALTKNRVRLTVMACTEMTTDVPEHSDLEPKEHWDRRARGLGPTRARPSISCGEENLLNLRGDPYPTENILIHEFGHAVHLMGMNTVDPTFDQRLRKAYADAKAAGLWQKTYAMENHAEYWGEGTQSWFGTNRRNDALHNDVDNREKLKKYDPPLAALLAEVYGDGPWRYRRPAHRPAAERQHLTGFAPSRAPAFKFRGDPDPAEKKPGKSAGKRK